MYFVNMKGMVRIYTEEKLRPKPRVRGNSSRFIGTEVAANCAVALCNVFAILYKLRSHPRNSDFGKVLDSLWIGTLPRIHSIFLGKAGGSQMDIFISASTCCRIWNKKLVQDE